MKPPELAAPAVSLFGFVSRALTTRELHMSIVFNTIAPVNTQLSQSSRTSWNFDLDRSVIFDVEVVPNRWLVGFLRHGSQDEPAFDQIENRDFLQAHLERIRSEGLTLVGYNSSAYDCAIVKAILDGADPFGKSQSIINSTRRRTPPDLGVDHVDLAKRVSSAGQFPSLKMVAANLGLPIDELPSAWFSEDADDERWERIREYNRRDLISTWEILRRLAPELGALALLSNDLGEDLRSIPSPQVVEKFFVKRYRESTGSEPPRIEIPSSVRYRPPDCVRPPTTAAAREWFDRITSEPLRIAQRDDGSIHWINRPDAEFAIGSLRVKVGLGGLHSNDEPRLYRQSRRRRLVLIDVASYYPSLIANFGFTPSSIGDAGRDAYRTILQRRLAVKEAAAAETDPVRKTELEAEERGLKLLLNSTFGKLGNQFSKLFDPPAMAATTLTGQALLINLIEELHAVGARVLSANTDGIFASVDRENDAYRNILEDWQSRTGLKLDVTPLKRLVTLKTNSGAYLTTRGKMRSFGKLKTELRPLASPNGLAIAESVVRAALFDTPIEETLDTITDPIRFAFVSSRTKKTRRAVLIAGDAETELGKVSRWYRARFAENEPKPRIVHEMQSGKRTKPAKADSVRLMYEVPDQIPADLDRSFYVREARSLYHTIAGIPRSRRLIEESPLAVEVFDRGLMPCPMRQKSVFTGCDPARPSLVWPWRRAETIGTYTGPETGLLVIDIDDPVRWRAAVTEAELRPERIEDLASAMVSARLDPADAVRSGRGRGKLIFRVDSFPLLKKPTTLHNSVGVDIFSGGGVPAVLGAGKDGSRYSLDGELGDAPAWLIDLLERRLATRPRRSTRRNRDAQASLLDFGSERDLDERFETLKSTLVSIEPELDTVDWSEREGENGTFLVGRCPFEHESGTSNPSDLSAGFGENGDPWIHCMHGSCTRSREVNDQLREIASAQVWPAQEPSESVPAFDDDLLRQSNIARAILAARNDGFTLHVAGCGAGKTHGIALAAILRARQRMPSLIAVPSIEAAQNLEKELRNHDARLFARPGLVARLYGQDRRNDELIPSASNDDDALESEPGPSGAYPITDETLIAIATHAQLMRRGFSRYIRGIYCAIAPKTIETDEDEPFERPAFTILIDEVHRFLESCRIEIPLAHRFKTSRAHDGNGGFHTVLARCPFTQRCGNCGNCKLAAIGGEREFNSYSIPEFRHHKSFKVDATGTPLSRPANPLMVSIEDFSLDSWHRVGTTIFAAGVRGFRGRPIDSTTRYNSAMSPFSIDRETGLAPIESNDEIMIHLLSFAFRPVVTRESIIDRATGEPVDPATISAMIETRSLDRETRDAYEWPIDPCQVETLRAVDLVAFDRLRRFSESYAVSIQGFTATATLELRDVLAEVFEDRLDVVEHEAPVRKIERLAIASIQGYTTISSLTKGPRNARKIVTEPLEEFSPVLLFAATKAHAVGLYRAVEGHHPGVRLIANRTSISTQVATRIAAEFRDDGSPPKTLIHYARGPLGTGANFLGLRTLVVDCSAYRRLASFTPGTIDRDAFEENQARERAAIVVQNVGRLLRGEPGKVALLVLLNAEPQLVEALARDPFIRQSVEHEPVVTPRYESPEALVQDACRWHGSNGVDPWQCSEVSYAVRESQRMTAANAERSECRRNTRESRRAVNRERLRSEAERAAREGESWRAFARRTHIERHFDMSEIETMRVLFENRAECPSTGT